jgi:cytochrome c-type biogenesis protein CcmE
VWSPGQAFEAERVLAKHDETYMPREVAEALKQRGEWKGP